VRVNDEVVLEAGTARGVVPWGAIPYWKTELAISAGATS
jgi:hypothetical protein